MGDGFYRPKDPTNSIKVLKEKAVKENNPKIERKHKLHMHTHTDRIKSDPKKCANDVATTNNSI